jgi:hypothetical protein
MPTLKNWALLPRTTKFDGTGTRRFVLCGYVEGHPDAPNGLVTTSPVTEIAADGSWARTRSRVYQLGEPDAYFREILHRQGKTLADLLNGTSDDIYLNPSGVADAELTNSVPASVPGSREGVFTEGILKIQRRSLCAT